MGSEIVTQSEVLDRELEDIFSDCLIEGNEKASVEILILSCLRKYADGDLKLKNILLRKLDPDGLNELISKSEFKTRLKEFILNYPQEIDDELVLTVESGGQFLKSERPDYWEENDILSASSLRLDDSFERLRILKDKNILLENSLVYTDQKIISLEKKLGRLQRESCKKIDFYKAETKRMENLILELQLKCSELEKKCRKLASDYASAEAELMNFKILEKKYEETEISFNIVNNENAEKKSELKIAEMINKNLQRKLDGTCKSREALIQEITLLKNEISQLTSNQAELLMRIESLQHEKQSLILELSELKTFDTIKSVKKELQIGQPTHKSVHAFNPCPFDNVSIQNELAECGYSLSTNSFDVIKNTNSKMKCKVFDVNESFLFLNSLNLEIPNSKILKRFNSSPTLNRVGKTNNNSGSVSTHSVQTENISDVSSECSREIKPIATSHSSSFTQTYPAISFKEQKINRIKSHNEDAFRKVNRLFFAKTEEHYTCTSFQDAIYGNDQMLSLKYLFILKKRLLPRNRKVLIVFVATCTIMLWLYSDGISDLLNNSLQTSLLPKL